MVAVERDPHSEEALFFSLKVILTVVGIIIFMTVVGAITS